MRRRLVLGTGANYTIVIPILQLITLVKCMPILLYRLECYTLLKADIRLLDFVVTRFLMKLFKSTNTDTINDCRMYFNFWMPSELVEIRKK